MDSRFYSDKLKKYTDKLVYVPYFVLDELQLDYDDPEKKEETEKHEEEIAHYITTPVVLNADLTIVQSETLRKAYVNVLNRHTNAPKGYWEEHISGLGSPKFDKVAESSKEEFAMPEEWERLINGRKTILYNTGLTAMLQHTNKFLEKIKSVLETFKAQEDVVLWWRPHPLLRATIESMHPELLEEYDEIVGEYRQDTWGIYDDTAELERAITCTNGYYGDWSSLVHLYEKTGKVIMIQSIENEMSCLDILTLSDVVEMLRGRIEQKNKSIYDRMKEKQGNILYNAGYVKIQFSTNLLEDVKTLLEIENTFREPLHKVRYGNILLRCMVEQIIEFKYLLNKHEEIEGYYGINAEIEQYDDIKIESLKIGEFVQSYKRLLESRYKNKKRNNVRFMTDAIDESKTKDDSDRLSLYDLYSILSNEMHNAYYLSELYMVDKIEFGEHDYSNELSIQKLWLNMTIYAFLEEYEREDNE